MELQILKPRKALNKAFLKVKPNRAEIESFKTNLIQLLDRTNDTESEEFHKNLVIDFLKKTYYDPNHFINTKGRNDLVIHNEDKAKSSVGVILEAKKPTNKSEMVTTEKLNTKAFQELVLYYLRERITHKNLEVKHLVITNINEWFIFDATTFDRLFAQNKNLVKQFNDFEGGRLADTKTDFFYKQIAEPLIAGITTEIEFTHFNLQDYQKLLRNDDKTDDSKLIALFKLLSPEHLLKLPFTNDSNSLDKRFYSELLHIIGLTETKEGSKKLIERNKEGERNTGSILEDAIIQLDSLDKISRLDRPAQFGNTQQERLFNVALELTITWINRILFLKLLEAQLITYHKGDKSYSFLNLDKIKNYDDLNSLFFQVLARKYDERNPDVKEIFEKVPYLNSSLFEPTDIEHSTLFISNLKDDKTIPIISSTVLKNDQGKKRTGKLSTLEYLFELLDAYDFSSEGSEEIQEDNKSLINASVLGLIFEKINSYKDGSFFTPGFITMYMCRETIRKAVVQKFNEAVSGNAQSEPVRPQVEKLPPLEEDRGGGPSTSATENKYESITDVYNAIGSRGEFSHQQANALINDIKICDPAVGSGHFLVSALNEMIAVKHDLGVLHDRQGKLLRDYDVHVENDELIITDYNGELFEYHPKNKESQRVQETLFHEKQSIIENCLFGVDINPNSVKICRLRLWIELLKNAYYKNETELETLPNIDINIKCGNSLISRFDLDADLSKALRSSKWNMDSYRIAVQTYRNAENKEQKHEMERLIADIKGDFKTEISRNSKEQRLYDKLSAELYEKHMAPKLFEEELSRAQKSKLKKEREKLETKVIKLKEQLDEIKDNKIYENAFEWRFEFPEVLDDEGGFVGFDVVIGNPPYGVSIKGNYRKHLVENLSKVPDYEIYYWFIDRGHQILKEKGGMSYIIPNSILFNVFAQNYRLSLFEKWRIVEILDCTDINIFEDATVRNIVFHFIKEKNSSTLGYRRTNNIESFQELIERESNIIEKTTVEANNQNWALIFKLDQEVLDIIKKVKTHTRKVSDDYRVTQGYIPYRKSDLIKNYGKDKANSIVKNREWHSNTKINEEYKEEIFGESISKYGYDRTGSFVWYGKHLATYVNPEFFNQKRLLIREITNPFIIASIVTEEFVNDPQIIIAIPGSSEVSVELLWAIMNSELATFFHFNSSPKATKGAFPKILVSDIKNFPIPRGIDESIDIKISTLVDQILTAKQEDPSADTTALEREIDVLVYRLYGLTYEEVKVVDEDFWMGESEYNRAEAN